MSEYTFKNLSEIDTVEEPADGTTMMGFQNGTPIQMPMSAVKSGGVVFVIDDDDPEYSTTDTAYGNKVKEALLSGKMVWRYTFQPATTAASNDLRAYTGVGVFFITEDTSGHILSLHLNNGLSLDFRITVD